MASADRLDILASLLALGLEPLVCSSLLSLLTPLELRRCQRVSKTWHSAVEAMWDRAERSAVGARWTRGEAVDADLMECRRERSVLTVSDVAMDEEVMAFALSSSGNVECWDRATMQRRWSVRAHPEGVYTVDVGRRKEGASGDGCKLVVSGGDDCLVRLWDADTGEEHAAVAAHDFIVWGVRLFLDTLVTASYDCTVAMWDVAGVAKGGKPPKLEKRIKVE